jgi:hypothetical protein
VLQELFQERHGISGAILTGDTPCRSASGWWIRSSRTASARSLPRASSSEKGFDASNLTSLFLATPIKFSGRLIQYLGRVLRPSIGKAQPKVYDFVDEKVGVLNAAARARAEVYADIGE